MKSVMMVIMGLIILNNSILERYELSFSIYLSDFLKFQLLFFSILRVDPGNFDTFPYDLLIIYNFQIGPAILMCIAFAQIFYNDRKNIIQVVS